MVCPVFDRCRMSMNATVVRIKTLSGFDVALAVSDLHVVVRILSRFALLECAIATSDVSVRLSVTRR